MTKTIGASSRSFRNTSNGSKLTEINNVDEKKTGLQRLREPFPPHQISLLPKPTSRDAKKGRCSECGGWHGLPAVHLSYVGHAALTDRLLECDESWSWEPVAFGPDGLPLLDKEGGMWIRLTVCGVTRLGYGDAQGKSGPDAMKERIGDALRNAAMRFGAALDLWHKGDLHKDEEPEDKHEDKPDGLPENEIADLQIAMREAEDMESLDRVSAPLQNLPLSETQRATLAAAYTKRRRELKTAA